MLALALAVLAVVAHAAALQLIDVKPYAAFQHYRPWQWIVAERPWGAWVLLLQAIVVASLGWRYRHAIRAAIGQVSIARAALVLLLIGFSLAVPTESIWRFAGESALAGIVSLVAVLNLALVALALPERSVARAADWVSSRVTLVPQAAGERRWDRHLPFALAIWISLLAAAASYFVFERLPHIDDSVSNLFQAKYFAAGHLTLPAPPDRESFYVDQTILREGKWFGYAFPGWPAVLAIGVLASAPWLVNPLLAGIQMLLAHAWLRRRFGRGMANLALLLLAASSWLIFTSGEMLGQPLTATLLLLVLVAFDRAREPDARWLRWSATAGLAAGFLMLTRAYDGVILAAALGLIMLIDGHVFRAWKAIVTTAMIAAAVAVLIFPYNRAVTGDARYPAHEAWADFRYGPGVDVLGFGPNVGITRFPNLDPLPGHGLPDVILNLNKNLFMVNIDLFGWAAGSLVLAYLAFGLGRWKREDAALLVLLGAYLAGYSAFYFSGGPDLGARYWYPILVVFAALSGRGAWRLTALLQSRGALSLAGARVGAAIALATVSAAVVMLPWRALTKHYGYRGVTAEIRELTNARPFEHALVFVRAPQNGRDYQSAFVLNPRTLDDPGTLYAFDAGPAQRKVVVAAFPDRPVWVIGRGEKNLDSGAPVRVLAGPLPPGTVPE